MAATSGVSLLIYNGCCGIGKGGVDRKKKILMLLGDSVYIYATVMVMLTIRTW